MTTTPLPALIPIDDPSITWDLSEMSELTCVNHPGARYLTKNPFTRGLHFVEADRDMARAWLERMTNAPSQWPREEISEDLVTTMAGTPTPSMECPCPMADLRLVRAG